jgi:hypothetical protein
MDTVRKAYHDAQQWAVGHAKHDLTAALLERFRFVEEFVGANPTATWKEIARAFAARPGATKADALVTPKRLRAGYRSVREELLLPDLAMGASADDLDFARAVSERYRRDELRKLWASAPGRETANGDELGVGADPDAGGPPPESADAQPGPAAPDGSRQQVRKSQGRVRRMGGKKERTS